MSKVILIKGSGRGKTFIGDLLETEYRNRKIACRRFYGELSPREIEQINKSTGHSIIETNLESLNITPWQTIEVTGGRQ